ncbi:MAG: endolytic transglycosylase MltG [bacterium]|nr:endolytic transglycosylase MltG [bacterium]
MNQIINMNFAFKIKIISVLLIMAIPFLYFGYRYYNRPKPKLIPPRAEINITIIPGWNLRQIAENWVAKGLVKTPDELYNLVGEPAKNYSANSAGAPRFDWANTQGRFDLSSNTSTLLVLFSDLGRNVTYEGYFLPETYRVYADAKLEDVVKKIFGVLDKKITLEMRVDIKKQNKSFFEILTMASIIEKEAPTGEMAKVADIFWRRHDMNWALQSCATVNYITGKSDPAINSTDRQINSLYNTYKYPGLPLGPIGNPSLNAIKATIYPEKNDYWYFMSDPDGGMHYAKTLDEHNANVRKYLR